MHDPYYDQSDAWVRNLQAPHQIARASKTVEAIPHHLETALDVGCGPGVVTNLLHAKASFVAGVDFSLSVVRFVKASRVCAVSDGLPFADRSFDAVVMTEVLEHLPEPVAARSLSEVRRVCRRYIFLSAPYREVLRTRQLRCRDCNCLFHADRHVASFDDRALRSLLLPEFRCDGIRRLGARHHVYPDLLMRLAQAFGVYASIQPGVAVCPQCGNQQNFVIGSKTARRLLLGLPRRLALLRKRSRWALASYSRVA